MITILVVEDSARDRETYRKILSKLDDVKVLEAESGEAALELLKNQRVDILLLDVMLPGINGFQLANSLRTMPFYAMTPVLFLTGYSKNPMGALRQYHCYDYIVKPFQVGELSERIHSLMKNYKNSQIAISPQRRKIIQLLAGNETVSIMTDQILFAESHLMDCTIQLPDSVLVLPRTSLNKVIKEVGEDFFVRCHKSYAVNVHHIASIEFINYRLSRIHIKCCDKILDCSARFKQEVENALKKG